MQENKLFLAGYLAAKPTVRYTPQGTAVANARLGQTYRFQKGGETKEHTNWFNLCFWGDIAHLVETLEKGANIYVEGSFDQRPYIRKDQTKTIINEVNVQKFFLIASLHQEREAAAEADDNATDASHEGADTANQGEVSHETWPI